MPVEVSYERVSGRTRAGKSGRTIICSKCRGSATIYHFSWSALVCLKCHEAVQKNEWLVIKKVK